MMMMTMMMIAFKIKKRMSMEEVISISLNISNFRMKIKTMNFKAIDYKSRCFILRQKGGRIIF